MYGRRCVRSWCAECWSGECGTGHCGAVRSGAVRSGAGRCGAGRCGAGRCRAGLVPGCVVPGCVVPGCVVPGWVVRECWVLGWAVLGWVVLGWLVPGCAVLGWAVPGRALPEPRRGRRGRRDRGGASTASARGPLCGAPVAASFSRFASLVTPVPAVDESRSARSLRLRGAIEGSADELGGVDIVLPVSLSSRQAGRQPGAGLGGGRGALTDPGQVPPRRQPLMHTATAGHGPPSRDRREGACTWLRSCVVARYAGQRGRAVML